MTASLSAILTTAKANNWCTKPFCTTCGSMEFRSEIKKFSRNELIENLKALSRLEVLSNRDAIITCFYRASAYSEVEDLAIPLKDTPCGDFLASIFEHKERAKQTKEKNERESIDRHYEKLERLREKASKDIFGAIRRKDFIAIGALVAKGADLSQLDENGVALEEKIRLLKTSQGYLKFFHYMTGSNTDP